ncbi:iron ABC transporter permease [Vibrio parahaemolyticus]|nr:iron ABC transporter permease [Vibrio parahaemolyticus]
MSASIISESPSSVSKSHWKASLFVCAMALCTLSGYTASMIGWSNFSLSGNDLTSYWFAFDEGNMLHQILATLRAPRTYAGLLIGASLAVSGVLMQGLTRNPLASPSILGINAGAACFMALASIGIPFFSQLNPIINAVFGALLSGGAVMLLGGFFSARSHPLRLVLAWRLDVMGLGEESATTLGTKPRQIQILALIAAVLLASISVSVAGTISFVGLLAPHLARLLFGHNHKLLIPASATLGALLVICADGLARGLQPPIELPAGVLTSVIGAPYFIFLLYRYRGW